MTHTILFLLVALASPEATHGPRAEPGRVTHGPHAGDPPPPAQTPRPSPSPVPHLLAEAQAAATPPPPAEASPSIDVPLALSVGSSGSGATDTSGASGTGVVSDASVRPTRKLTLRDLMSLAVLHYPELPIVQAESDGAKALLSLAQWTRYTPKLTLTSVFGVVPAARGSIFDSPDTPRDLNDLGPFYRARLDASLPLYTFGKLSSATDAARAFVAAKDAKGDAKRDTARGLAARAYFGYLLALGDLKAVGDVRKDLDRLLERLDHPKEDDPTPEPFDKLRARTYGFELDRAQAQAERGLAIARAGLRELVHGAPGDDFGPRATELVPLATEVPDLEAGLAEALERNPELREARLEAEARTFYAKSTGADRWPAFSAEGRYEQGEADNRQKQQNPFIYEPFNVKSLAVTLALKWDLNFEQTGARARKDATDAAAARAKSEALVAKTKVEVSEAHARLVEAEKTYEASRGALSTGASWLRVADENFGLESASVKDVIDAYTVFARARSANLDALHALNLAVVDWRLAIGREPLEEGEDP